MQLYTLLSGPGVWMGAMCKRSSSNLEARRVKWLRNNTGYNNAKLNDSDKNAARVGGSSRGASNALRSALQSVVRFS